MDWRWSAIYILVLIKCDELKIEFRIILDWNYAHCEARPLKLLSLWSDETESIRLYLKIPIWVFFVTCWHPYLKSPRSWLLHMSSIIFKIYPSMSSHMKSSLQCLLIATCYKRKWNKWWLKASDFLRLESGSCLGINKLRNGKWRFLKSALLLF